MEHRIQVTGHFAVSTMQLADLATDAWLVEVGAPQDLAGCFQRSIGSAVAEYKLSFITENGDAFRVVNNPAGAAIGGLVDALVYPVKLSLCARESSEQFLWVISPWSYE